MQRMPQPDTVEHVLDPATREHSADYPLEGFRGAVESVGRLDPVGDIAWIHG
jgi:hypothetical protein